MITTTTVTVPAATERPIESNGAIVKAVNTDLTDAELAVIIRTEIQKCRMAWSNALDHAMNAGDALIAAQSVVLAAGKKWKKWVKKDCYIALSTAALYMQLARHRDEIETRIRDGVTLSLRAARKLISEPKEPPAPEAPREPVDAKNKDDDTPAAQSETDEQVSQETIIQAINGRRKSPAAGSGDHGGDHDHAGDHEGNGAGLDRGDDSNHAESASRTPNANSSTKSKAKTPPQKVSWDATPADRSVIRDLVLEEYFKKTTGVDLLNHIRAARSDIIRHFLDALGVDAMLAEMSLEFGQRLRARLPNRKKKTITLTASAPAGANNRSWH